jgi:hypothetical protein
MACIVRVPTENVKQKLQAGIHSSTIGCVKAIIKEGGAAGFYQGCAPPPSFQLAAAQLRRHCKAVAAVPDTAHRWRPLIVVC